MGSSMGIPGGSNVDWTVGSTGASVTCGSGTTAAGTGTAGTGAAGNALGGSVVTSANQQLGAAQSPNCIPASSTPATITGTNPATTTPEGETTP
jgi:hypothetical protein